MAGGVIAIIGGGPAGLMAAEVLSSRGHAVALYDAMPTFGRKFLLAGKSGLNLTHSEDHARFVSRFGAASERLAPVLDAFTAKDLREWVQGLGIATFVGSSGRVFPVMMKASPLLRGWLARLSAQGVRLAPRHRWTGFVEGALSFETPSGPIEAACDATLLALGGASWPRLGSNGAWVPWLSEKDIAIEPFQPANCGFDVDWSAVMVERFAGEPVKSVSATSASGTSQGEFVVTRTGIEGSLFYAHSAALRDTLLRGEPAYLTLDLAPGRGKVQLAESLARQGEKASLSNRLRKGAGLSGVKAALLRECGGDVARADAQRLAGLIKALPLPVIRPRPIAEAISSAGGVALSGVDARFMLTALPGVFVAGEMLDWEAPTGGYLLTAAFATGRAAANGVDDWLAGRAGAALSRSVGDDGFRPGIADAQRGL